MVADTATATELKNNLGKYLNLVMEGQEVVVTRNGNEIGRLVPRDATASYLTDSLIGILKGEHDIDCEKQQRLAHKHETVD